MKHKACLRCLESLPTPFAGLPLLSKLHPPKRLFRPALFQKALGNMDVVWLQRDRLHISPLTVPHSLLLLFPFVKHQSVSSLEHRPALCCVHCTAPCYIKPTNKELPTAGDINLPRASGKHLLKIDEEKGVTLQITQALVSCIIGYPEKFGSS